MSLTLCPRTVRCPQGKLELDKVLVAISAAGLKGDISTDLAHAIWCAVGTELQRSVVVELYMQQTSSIKPSTLGEVL